MARIAIVGPVTAEGGKSPESGVGQYLVELVGALSGRHRVTVLAQEDSVERRAGPALVRPTWSPSAAAPSQVWRALSQVRPDVVHLQHEFNLYGGQLPSALVAAAASLQRGLRRPLVTTVHGVVNPDHVTPKLVADNYLPHHVRAVRSAFQFAYRTLATMSTRLIVHHAYFSDVLQGGYGVPARKISVVPLGYSDEGCPSRDRPEVRTVLVLGFLTGYKDPEAVVALAESDLVPDVAFKFCVGRNPRVASPDYEDRYRRLVERIKAVGEPRASFQGFVPEEELEGVLRSSSALVLPYSQCLAASAVAGLALRYALPICYSEELAPLLGVRTGMFRLGDPASLAEALDLVTTSDLTWTSELFAPWAEVARRTEEVWDSL